MLKVLVEGCGPQRGTKYSACVDLFASESVLIDNYKTCLIPLGVKIDKEALRSIVVGNKNFTCEMEEDIFEVFKKTHFLQLMLRSSLSKHLIIANGVGVIDMDYDGEIMMRVHNPSDSSYHVAKGDKVAQITLLSHRSDLFNIDTETKRTGGFGSTDKEAK